MDISLPSGKAPIFSLSDLSVSVMISALMKKHAAGGERGF
jgi:hypothetical protein